MIIWIASYPKSGNTWVRSLLSSYLYTNNGIFNFSLLRKIDQFPSRKYFEFFLKDFSDIKKVSEYWIAAQDRINLFNDKIVFFKTHSALCTLENNRFTNKNNTKAVIYVVRDPRNIITSISHHYSQDTLQSSNFIFDKNRMIAGEEWGNKDFGLGTMLGDWSNHYKSWKNIKFAPIKIIKYEDLVNNPENTFISILNFLKNFMDINIQKKKIANVINSCSFDILSDKEKEEGFEEAAIHKKTGKKLKFFNLGKKNNWQTLLDPEIEKKTKKIFMQEMKELGYI